MVLFSPCSLRVSCTLRRETRDTRWHRELGVPSHSAAGTESSGSSTLGRTRVQRPQARGLCRSLPRAPHARQVRLLHPAPAGSGGGPGPGRAGRAPAQLRGARGPEPPGWAALGARAAAGPGREGLRAARAPPGGRGAGLSGSRDFCGGFTGKVVAGGGRGHPSSPGRLGTGGTGRPAAAAPRSRGPQPRDQQHPAGSRAGSGSGSAAGTAGTLRTAAGGGPSTPEQPRLPPPGRGHPGGRDRQLPPAQVCPARVSHGSRSPAAQPQSRLNLAPRWLLNRPLPGRAPTPARGSAAHSCSATGPPMACSGLWLV